VKFKPEVQESGAGKSIRGKGKEGEMGKNDPGEAKTKKVACENGGHAGKTV